MVLSKKDQELQDFAEGINLQPRQHFDHNLDTPYPLIDNDPHFFRVLRYYRLQDYVTLVAGTAFAPGVFYLMETYEKSVPPRYLMSNLRGCTVLGFFGGFFLSYLHSSKRFWGWSENEREQKKDFAEMRQRWKEGKPFYGHSSLDTYYQEVASNNSRYAALKFASIPWFNFVNHNYHGVDVTKYMVDDPEETKEADKSS